MEKEIKKSKGISVSYILLGIILIIEFLYSFICIANSASTSPLTFTGELYVSLIFGALLLLPGISFLFFGLDIFERDKKSNASAIIFIGAFLGFLFIFSQTLVRGFTLAVLISPIIYIVALVGLICLLTSIGNFKRIVYLVIFCIVATVIFAWFFNSLGCSLKIIQSERDDCFQNFSLNTQTLEPCSKITPGDTKDYCYLNLAIGTGPSHWDGTKFVKDYSPLNEKISKEKICSYIVSDVTREKCLH